MSPAAPFRACHHRLAARHSSRDRVTGGERQIRPVCVPSHAWPAQVSAAPIRQGLPDAGRSPSRCVISPRLEQRAHCRRSVADSASLIELSGARRSGCSASCWPGCSFTVGVVTSCWKVASLELAFASVAGCRSRMTAHLRRSGTRPRSPARRSAAGYGCGIVIRERPRRQPSAELPGQGDDDALGAADVTQPVASCC